MVLVVLVDLVNKVEQVVLEYQIQFQEVQLLMLEEEVEVDVEEVIIQLNLLQQEEDHLVELEEQVLVLAQQAAQEQLTEVVAEVEEVVDPEQ